ncbi:unnamed protein product [Lactuca virosa]|uniref:Ribosomal RNA-processing protein 7 C-terminal domain-containing protein n=1 Tax=Lactuca virosa TaxID=75947 RepID=A0AAU9MSK0_9ASTR|nr:unnamed protein product [Lactuca virosa]
MPTVHSSTSSSPAIVTLPDLQRRRRTAEVAFRVKEQRARARGGAKDKGTQLHSRTLRITEGATSDKKMKKVSRNKKKREGEPSELVISTSHVNEGKNIAGMSDKKKKLKKKKRNKENNEGGDHEGVPHDNVGEDDVNQQNDNNDGANSPKKAARNKKRKGMETSEVAAPPTPDDVKTSDKKKKKLKKKKKKGKEDGVVEHLLHSSEVGAKSNQQIGKSKSISQINTNDNEDGVYQISSGDEDETTGMKRWIGEYHGGRPGAEVLLQRINDFLVDYWAQKDKERKERESEAAEGGWTVVTHMKGRKKTTDVESGTTVGSVAQAAVVDNISKKKNKQNQDQVGLTFYRFQRREAQRNEIMMLQSKFEQDKKRIQQMRAERKFRPY